MFLYYSMEVDITMLVALSATALEQENLTNKVMKKVKKFLNYAASHQDAIIM